VASACSLTRPSTTPVLLGPDTESDGKSELAVCGESVPGSAGAWRLSGQRAGGGALPGTRQALLPGGATLAGPRAARS